MKKIYLIVDILSIMDGSDTIYEYSDEILTTIVKKLHIKTNFPTDIIFLIEDYIEIVCKKCRIKEDIYICDYCCEYFCDFCFRYVSKSLCCKHNDCSACKLSTCRNNRIIGQFCLKCWDIIEKYDDDYFVENY